MHWQSFLNRYLFNTGSPPGFKALPWRTRCVLKLRAFIRFFSCGEGLRLLAYSLIWLLAGNLLVWTYDLSGRAALLPAFTLCLWAGPWLKRSHCSQLRQLLHEWWSVR